MGNAASILQSLVQSPEDRLFGYLQAIRHVMDDPTVEKPTPSVSGALLEACFVYVFVSETEVISQEKVTQWTRSLCVLHVELTRI